MQYIYVAIATWIKKDTYVQATLSNEDRYQKNVEEKHMYIVETIKTMMFQRNDILNCANTTVCKDAKLQLSYTSK